MSKRATFPTLGYSSGLRPSMVYVCMRGGRTITIKAIIVIWLGVGEKLGGNPATRIVSRALFAPCVNTLPLLRTPYVLRTPYSVRSTYIPRHLDLGRRDAPLHIDDKTYDFAALEPRVDFSSLKKASSTRVSVLRPTMYCPSSRFRFSSDRSSWMEIPG